MAGSRELFDFVKLQDELRAAKTSENTILLEEYAVAFVDLAGFFDLLGTAFSFVAKDIRELVKIIRAHHAESPDHYATLQSMVAHEVAAGIVTAATEAKSANAPRQSGSGAVLSMHRILDFVKRFMNQLKDMPDDGSTSNAAATEYKATLAKYDSWVVQKVAVLATKLLPVRKVFLERNIKQPKDELEAMGDDVISLMQEIVDITKKLFEENDLLELK